jgi:manganese transport protein
MLLTLVPAAAMIMLIKDTFQALIISQVCLSVQLPLTMLPLFLLTNDKRLMGKFVNRWAENVLMVISGLIIVVLNVLLIYVVLGGKF